MSSKTQQKLLIIKKEDILYVNMSKTASASEKPNLFEFFRAPKVFEQSSKIVQAENRVLARAVRTRSQIAERERFIQYKAKARFWLC